MPLQPVAPGQGDRLRDIFVACIDGLTGFTEAVHTAYPQTSVQLCIVHLVRAALRYVTDQDSKAVVRDLKRIYSSATVLEAEEALEGFAEAWDAKYPTISKMWRAKWPDIITLFDCSPPIRRAIYTTNAIESINSVIRTFTSNRKIYPNEESALKLIYMAIREASRRWTMPVRNWKEAINHFAILFETRLAPGLGSAALDSVIADRTTNTGRRTRFISLFPLVFMLMVTLFPRLELLDLFLQQIEIQPTVLS